MEEEDKGHLPARRGAVPRRRAGQSGLVHLRRRVDGVEGFYPWRLSVFPSTPSSKRRVCKFCGVYLIIITHDPREGEESLGEARAAARRQAALVAAVLV